MKFDFLGQVAIVTGAGSGIGKATALGFGAAGAKVAVLDIAAAERDGRGDRPGRRRGPRDRLDVRDADRVDARRSQRSWAVSARSTSWSTMPASRCRAIPRSMCPRRSGTASWTSTPRASGSACGAVLPILIAKQRGKICNVASTASHIGLRDAAAYCASKGGGSRADPAGGRAIRRRQHPDQLGLAGDHDDRDPEERHRRAAGRVPEADPDQPLRRGRRGRGDDPLPLLSGSLRS